MFLPKFVVSHILIKKYNHRCQAASASGEQAEEREQSPVHILPETLVSGAMSVAAKAFSSAEAIMRSIQSPMSSTTSFTVC